MWPSLDSLCCNMSLDITTWPSLSCGLLLTLRVAIWKREREGRERERVLGILQYRRLVKISSVFTYTLPWLGCVKLHQEAYLLITVCIDKCHPLRLMTQLTHGSHTWAEMTDTSHACEEDKNSHIQGDIDTTHTCEVMKTHTWEEIRKIFISGPFSPTHSDRYSITTISYLWGHLKARSSKSACAWENFPCIVTD